MKKKASKPTGFGTVNVRKCPRTSMHGFKVQATLRGASVQSAMIALITAVADGRLDLGPYLPKEPVDG